MKTKDEAVGELDEPVISGHDDVRRWLDLAAAVSKAATDEEALQIMRDATGLTMTDPDADRAEINRRTQQD